MTREEAIKQLNTMVCATHINGMPLGSMEEVRESLLMAIEALEQEPCADAVSRCAVNEIINDTRDCISVEGYWAILERMKKLPPINPQEPKTGHWIDKFGGVYRCSVCRELIELDCEITTPKSIEKFMYCPHCGAKMV